MVDILPEKMGRFSCRERIARTASTETLPFFSGQLYPIIALNSSKFISRNNTFYVFNFDILKTSSIFQNIQFKKC